MPQTSRSSTPRRLPGSRLGTLAAMAWLLAAPGCGDPCRELSDTVCNCMTTRQAQQDCRRRVHALANQQRASASQAQRCAELQASCTCEALARGELAACGLARE